jgi:hypothetical protein
MALSQGISSDYIEAQRNTITFDGTFQIAEMRYRHGTEMALTDTFVKNTKSTDKPSGDKCPDGDMYLPAGKTCREGFAHGLSVCGQTQDVSTGIPPCRITCQG